MHHQRRVPASVTDYNELMTWGREAPFAPPYHQDEEEEEGEPRADVRHFPLGEMAWGNFPLFKNEKTTLYLVTFGHNHIGMRQCSQGTGLASPRGNEE